MGNTPFPAQLVKHLAVLHDATVFIETGTYIGTTTRWAAANFAEVHTIELLEMLFKETSASLASLPNVKCYHGDSRALLPGIIKSLDQRRTVMWLDGHCSCDGDPNEKDECPLLNEIACVNGELDIVLIDDARLFLRVPPAPHDPSQWPSLHQVIEALPDDMFVQIIGDVIWAVPESLRAALTEYLHADRSPW